MAERSGVSDSRLRGLAASGLVAGAVLGVAGAFVGSAPLRGLAWGLDGTALVVACGILTVQYARRGNDGAAAGFLIFAVGEALILSTAAMDLPDTTPLFGAGVGLWAASLAVVGTSGAMPGWVNVIGYVGAVLFAIVALQIFRGGALTPLSQPLPFLAYPFLAATLLGWAWVELRSAGTLPSRGVG